MEITGFGAIMKFALERENDLKSILEKAGKNEGLSSLHDKIGAMVIQCKKDIKLLERTRRENINEMVLQPISGLEDGNYLFQTPSVDGISYQEFGEFLEESTAKIAGFYDDAADKLPVDEVKRIFKRLAKKRLFVGKSG